MIPRMAISSAIADRNHARNASTNAIHMGGLSSEPAARLIVERSQSLAAGRFLESVGGSLRAAKRPCK